MPGKRTIWRGFIIATLLVLLFVPARVTIAQTSSGTSPQCSTLPDTINVWLVIFKNEWPAGTDFLMNVPFEDYVYGVVMGELGPQVPTHCPGLRPENVALRAVGKSGFMVYDWCIRQ